MRGLVVISAVFGLTLGSAETVNFDRARVNSLPPGWTILGPRSSHLPRWRIEVDKSAPSRPHVLAPAVRAGRDGASIALYDSSLCRDGEVSVDLKLISGRAEEAGVVWRFQDPGNYYVALISGEKDRVAVYRRFHDQVSLISPAAIPHHVDDKAWNLLRVVFRGQTINLYLGHRKLLEVIDGQISDAGKIGLWTRADTLAYFDNFRMSKRD